MIPGDAVEAAVLIQAVQDVVSARKERRDLCRVIRAHCLDDIRDRRAKTLGFEDEIEIRIEHHKRIDDTDVRHAR